MSENDSMSSQHFASHSTHLDLMGSVAPRLLPHSWDLLLDVFSTSLSLSQNIEYPAYFSVMLFISDSSLPSHTFHYLSPLALSFIFSFFLQNPCFSLSLLINLFFLLVIWLHHLFYACYLKFSNLLYKLCLISGAASFEGCIWRPNASQCHNTAF